MTTEIISLQVSISYNDIIQDDCKMPIYFQKKKTLVYGITFLLLAAERDTILILEDWITLLCTFKWPDVRREEHI